MSFVRRDSIELVQHTIEDGETGVFQYSFMNLARVVLHIFEKIGRHA